MKRIIPKLITIGLIVLSTSVSIFAEPRIAYSICPKCDELTMSLSCGGNGVEEMFGSKASDGCTVYETLADTVGYCKNCGSLGVVARHVESKRHSNCGTVVDCCRYN